MSDDDSEANKMRNALSGIANEIQKYIPSINTVYNESVTASRMKCFSGQILNNPNECKAILDMRNKQEIKLRRNLKTACAVATTMSSAKATETESLNNHLDDARNKYMDLVQQQSKKNEIINDLSAENNVLRNQLEFYNKVIELGYKELQKIRNKCIENVSTLEQLKYIIVCCGQYYTNHCNEHDKCTRLEQKNRFLSTKIIIMENNLEAATNELRNLRNYIKPCKDKKYTIRGSRHCIGAVRSEYIIGSYQKNVTNQTMAKKGLNNRPSPTNIRDLYLTSHLKTVKKLLEDQDNLIKHLKNLSI